MKDTFGLRENKEWLNESVWIAMGSDLKGNDIIYKKRTYPLKYGCWRIIIVTKYVGLENKSKYNKDNLQLKLTKLWSKLWDCTILQSHVPKTIRTIHI